MVCGQSRGGTVMRRGLCTVMLWKTSVPFDPIWLPPHTQCLNVKSNINTIILQSSTDLLKAIEDTFIPNTFWNPCSHWCFLSSSTQCMLFFQDHKHITFEEIKSLLTRVNALMQKKERALSCMTYSKDTVSIGCTNTCYVKYSWGNTGKLYRYNIS